MNDIMSVAESEYELAFFDMTKQRFFASLRETNSYFQSATPYHVRLITNQLKFLCVRASPCLCVSLNNKSFTGHDMSGTKKTSPPRKPAS